MVSTPRVVSVEIDSENEKRLTSKMTNRDIIRRRDNLAEVTVEFLDADAPGLFAALSTELAMNGINIQEIYSTDAGPMTVSEEQEGQYVVAEMSFIVFQKDALKAYQALQELSDG
jgi:predicted regulator of amino acid metabolism with ACT domain